MAQPQILDVQNPLIWGFGDMTQLLSMHENNPTSIILVLKRWKEENQKFRPAWATRDSTFTERRGLGIATQVFNPSTEEAKAGGSL